MKNRLLIRAEAGSQVGFGHFTRCLALAKMVAPSFSKIIFVTGQIPAKQQEMLQEENFEHFLVSYENDFLNEIHSTDSVVLDGYHFDINLEKEVKRRAQFSLVVDDLFNRDYVADVLLNHAPYAKMEMYPNQPESKLALGLSYALFREEFFEIPEKPRLDEKPTRLFLCLGGSNLSEKVLEILADIESIASIKEIELMLPDVVAFKKMRWEKLPKYSKKLILREGMTAMEVRDSMLSASACLVSSGSLSLEVCLLQRPLYLICVAENQRHNYEFLQKTQCAKDWQRLGGYTLENAHKMLACQRKLKQGHPKENLRKLFTKT